MNSPEFRLIKYDVIELNRTLLSQMTEGERILFLECIFIGYCQDCGRITGDKQCPCTNDE